MVGREDAGARAVQDADAAGRVVPLRRPSPLPRLTLARIIPSGRSVAAGLALVAAAAVAYVAARQTSVFAVRQIAVEGGGAAVASDVRRALAAYRGRSLLSVDVGAAERRIIELASVEGARLDRAFPNTIEVVVRPGRPVAVVRRGANAWLVSASGTVLRPVPPRTVRRLPRIWVDARTDVVAGAAMRDRLFDAVRAAAFSARFPARVAFVRASVDELTLVLADRFEVRLGDGGDLPLKMAIARRVLPKVGRLAAPAYLDVSVPTRVVARQNPQLEG